MHSKGNHHSRGRLSTQEVDSWQKKTSTEETPAVISASQLETSNIVHDHHIPAEATEKSGSYPQGRPEGESVSLVFDSNDDQAQVNIHLIYISLRFL